MNLNGPRRQNHISVVTDKQSTPKENRISGSTYNLKGVGDNADSHELLAVVTAVHHQRIGETLNDGTLGLAETFGSVSAGRGGR